MKEWPESELADLDPTGKGWIYKRSESISRNPPDSCELVLIRDVKYRQQVYNNYGPLNNIELLSVYGFVDRDNPVKTVCLRRELFLTETEYYIPDSQRTRFWSEQGFEFLQSLAQHEARPFADEWDKMNRMETIPERGRDWVNWSLTLGLDPPVRCGLKVWLLLLVIHPSAWQDFLALSMPAKVEFMLLYLKAFMEEKQLSGVEERTLLEWLQLLEKAITKRLARAEGPGVIEFRPTKSSDDVVDFRLEKRANF